MNFKRSTTSMTLVLMVLSLISVTAVQQDVFAQDAGMSITATADKGSDTITITGQTFSVATDVTLIVKSPSGNNRVDIDQISPEADGRFVKEFKIGSTWNEDGRYKITATSGSSSLYHMFVEVLVINGMTEKTFVTESNLGSGIVNLGPNVAKDAGIELDVVAEYGSAMFMVSGLTDRLSQDITLTVKAPNGNVATISQVSPEIDGKFATIINIGGSLWNEDGFYTVTAQQSDDPKYIATSEVEIEGGVIVPEFGAIAAMILAVAIITIIAVSAKSRLSIIPRY